MGAFRRLRGLPTAEAACGLKRDPVAETHAADETERALPVSPPSKRAPKQSDLIAHTQHTTELKELLSALVTRPHADDAGGAAPAPISAPNESRGTQGASRQTAADVAGQLDGVLDRLARCRSSLASQSSRAKAAAATALSAVPQLPARPASAATWREVDRGGGGARTGAARAEAAKAEAARREAAEVAAAAAAAGPAVWDAEMARSEVGRCFPLHVCEMVASDMDPLRELAVGRLDAAIEAAVAREGGGVVGAVGGGTCTVAGACAAAGDGAASLVGAVACGASGGAAAPAGVPAPEEEDGEPRFWARAGPSRRRADMSRPGTAPAGMAPRALGASVRVGSHSGVGSPLSTARPRGGVDSTRPRGDVDFWSASGDPWDADADSPGDDDGFARGFGVGAGADAPVPAARDLASRDRDLAPRDRDLVARDLAATADTEASEAAAEAAAAEAAAAEAAAAMKAAAQDAEAAAEAAVAAAEAEAAAAEAGGAAAVDGVDSRQERHPMASPSVSSMCGEEEDDDAAHSSSADGSFGERRTEHVDGGRCNVGLGEVLLAASWVVRELLADASPQVRRCRPLVAVRLVHAAPPVHVAPLIHVARRCHVAPLVPSGERGGARSPRPRPAPPRQPPPEVSARRHPARNTPSTHTARLTSYRRVVARGRRCARHVACPHGARQSRTTRGVRPPDARALPGED